MNFNVVVGVIVKRPIRSNKETTDYQRVLKCDFVVRKEHKYSKKRVAFQNDVGLF